SVQMSAPRGPANCAARNRDCRNQSWMRSAQLCVRIGNAKPRQNLDLEAFHSLRLACLLMIVAEQMQKSVDRKMDEMILERLLFLLCLAFGRRVADDDIAEQNPLAWLA